MDRVLKIVPGVHSREVPPNLGPINDEMLELSPSNERSNGASDRKAASGRAKRPSSVRGAVMECVIKT